MCSTALLKRLCHIAGKTFSTAVIHRFMERRSAYHNREVSITSVVYSWTAVLACFVHSPVVSVDTLEVGFTALRCSICAIIHIEFEQRFITSSWINNLYKNGSRELANGRSSSAFAVWNLCFNTLTTIIRLVIYQCWPMPPWYFSASATYLHRPPNDIGALWRE